MNYEFVRSFLLDGERHDAAIIPAEKDTIFYIGPSTWYERPADDPTAFVVPPASQHAKKNVPVGGKYHCYRVSILLFSNRDTSEKQMAQNVRNLQTNQSTIHVGYGFLLSPSAFSSMLSMIDDILDTENVCHDGLLVVTSLKDTIGHSVHDFAKFMTTVMWPGQTFQYAGSFKSER